jgi:hypothetical protein
VNANEMEKAANRLSDKIAELIHKFEVANGAEVAEITIGGWFTEGGAQGYVQVKTIIKHRIGEPR